MRDTRELPESQQIPNKAPCRGEGTGVVARVARERVEIYANASVNKRNEARC